MVVEGFSEVINKSEVATVCGISYRLKDCRKQLALELPDILLLDIEMPDGNGIDFFMEIKNKYPTMKIIALTTHSEYSIISYLLEHKISGYILKSACSDEINVAIGSVFHGQTFLCDETLAVLNNKREIPIRLTNRELELLGHLVKGLTNEQAAQKMFLTTETVKSYRKNIKSKLNAQSAIEMGKIAYQGWKFFLNDDKK